MFAGNKICIKFAPSFMASIELWCNGNTADSGSAFPGSNPGSSTNKNPPEYILKGIFA